MRAGRGFRAGTRKKFRKPYKSKFTVENYIKEFSLMQRVIVDSDPSSNKNIPHYRYNGKVGTVISKRGRSYVVKINLGKKDKILMLRPEHLKPAR